MAGVTFAEQMQLDADGARPGRYHVDVSADWNCPVVPQGGMMAALAARAMKLELQRDNGADPPILRSMTTVFAAPVPAGPVEIDVTVLRQGRSMAQARAEVRTPGSDVGHSTLAVFGPTRPGFEFTDVTMPDAPAPEDCPSFRDPLPDEAGDQLPGPLAAFWHKADGRPALGHAPWDDYVPTTSECAYWYRFDEPPHHDDSTICPLGLIPFCDLNPGSVRERMGPGTPNWMPPSADLTVHLFGETRSEWLLGAYKAHRASDGYASVAVDLWDPITGLVAHATQVTILVFPDGPPVGDQRFPADLRRA